MNLVVNRVPWIPNGIRWTNCARSTVQILRLKFCDLQRPSWKNCLAQQNNNNNNRESLVRLLKTSYSPTNWNLERSNKKLSREWPARIFEKKFWPASPPLSFCDGTQNTLAGGSCDEATLHGSPQVTN